MLKCDTLLYENIPYQDSLPKIWSQRGHRYTAFFHILLQTWLTNLFARCYLIFIDVTQPILICFCYAGLLYCSSIFLIDVFAPQVN